MYLLNNLGDDDFEKAAKVNSNTQLYKQVGNSIVVNVLEAILKNLLLKQYDYENYLCEENDKLQQENQQLKIQVSAREEVANKYKKVIDETRHYVEKECNDLLIGYFHNRFDITEYYEKLLQILDKGESNE